MTAIWLIALWLWLRAEGRAQRAWVEHPARPWNVYTRAARAAMDWQRAEYERHRDDLHPH